MRPAPHWRPSAVQQHRTPQAYTRTARHTSPGSRVTTPWKCLPRQLPTLPTPAPDKYNQSSQMSLRPQNPNRPVTPSSTRPGTHTDGASDGLPDGLPDDETGEEEIPADFAETAQPHEEDGVMEDMATLAVNPGGLAGVRRPFVCLGSGRVV